MRNVSPVDLSVLDPDVQRAFALDPGQVFHPDRSRASYRSYASPSSRNGSAFALNERYSSASCALVDAEQRQAPGKRRRVRRILRAEAAVTAAVVAGAEGAAAGVRDRPQARRSVGDHNADIAGELALQTNAVSRRSPACGPRERREDFEQLLLVDRAAAQFEVDRHVLADRGRRRQGVDIFGLGVHGAHQTRRDIAEVSQGLDAARRSRRRRWSRAIRDLARTSWMRRTSCGVAIEPSTSDRS